MTKKTFGSRKYNRHERFDAIWSYHMWLAHCDWAIVHWETGQTKQGDAAMKQARFYLGMWVEAMAGKEDLAAYGRAVCARWEKIFNREKWITDKIAEIRQVREVK